MKIRWLSGAAAFAMAGVVVAVLPASATIIVEVGNNPQVDENVQFNNGEVDNAPLIQGSTNQSGFLVDFFGAGEDLTSRSRGQARVEAEDGSTLDALTVALNASGSSFTSLIYNLDAVKDGSVTFTVNQVVGDPFVDSFDLDKNGQNFFTITAIDGSRITSVGLASTVGLQDVAQVRIGRGGTVVVVPEPASLGLLGLGALGLLARRRHND